jgi:prepilin-type N-terminal cleavage/methylation domain-containing protein
MRADRCGMTLVELMAAIAIAGLVLLGALLLLGGVTDSVHRIEDDATSVTAAGTTTRRLHQLLNDATATDDTTKRFEGDQLGFAFWSRCAQAQGWMASCAVTVELVDTARGTAFHVSFANGQAQTLRRYDRPARLRYFDADHEAWRTAWNASATIPAALEVVVGTDTMIYSLGPARE